MQFHQRFVPGLAIASCIFNEFDDFTGVCPAHGAGSPCGKAIGSRRCSTVDHQRRFSPALQKKREEQWGESLLNEMPLSPPCFKRMKQGNKQGPAIIEKRIAGQKTKDGKTTDYFRCPHRQRMERWPYRKIHLPSRRHGWHGCLEGGGTADSIIMSHHTELFIQRGLK